MAAAAIPAIISLIAAVAPHLMNQSGQSQPGQRSSRYGEQQDPEGYSRISTFDPQQQQLFGQTAQGLGGIQPQIMQYLQQLLSPDSQSAEAFAAPYKRQFEEQTIPGIAERFAGVGGLSSSGFQQALGQAGAGLTENLAALREGQRSQAISPIMQMIQSLLGQQAQAFLPKQQSGFQQFLTGVAPGLAQGLGQAGGAWALNKFGGG